MPYAHVNDLELHYEMSGARDGPPLVLLYGAGEAIDDPARAGGPYSLRPSAEELRVIAVEHCGHGRTTNPAGFMSLSGPWRETAESACMNALVADWSDAADGPEDAARTATDLYTLLERAHVPGRTCWPATHSAAYTSSPSPLPTRSGCRHGVD